MRAMDSRISSHLKRAYQQAENAVKKRWQEYRQHEVNRKLAREAATKERVHQEERNRFFSLILAKRTGSSADEMPPLVCDPDTTQKAVFLVTTPISFGRVALSKSTYKLLAKHVGMSLDSVSHWLLAVIDRGYGDCFYYELMSDEMALNMLGKNVFRTGDVTPAFIATWSSCYYVGETTKSHEVIQQLGRNHTLLQPRYNLLSNNCQDLVETLVTVICDGKIINQAKLKEELSLVSPRLALDLMIARLRSKMDAKGDPQDVDKVKNNDRGVDEDVNIIKTLWNRIQR